MENHFFPDVNNFSGSHHEKSNIQQKQYFLQNSTQAPFSGGILSSTDNERYFHNGIISSKQNTLGGGTNDDTFSEEMENSTNDIVRFNSNNYDELNYNQYQNNSNKSHNFGMIVNNSNTNINSNNSSNMYNNTNNNVSDNHNNTVLPATYYYHYHPQQVNSTCDNQNQNFNNLNVNTNNAKHLNQSCSTMFSCPHYHNLNQMNNSSLNMTPVNSGNKMNGTMFEYPEQSNPSNHLSNSLLSHRPPYYQQPYQYYSKNTIIPNNNFNYKLSAYEPYPTTVVSRSNSTDGLLPQSNINGFEARSNYIRPANHTDIMYNDSKKYNNLNYHYGGFHHKSSNLYGLVGNNRNYPTNYNFPFIRQPSNYSIKNTSSSNTSDINLNNNIHSMIPKTNNTNQTLLNSQYNNLRKNICSSSSVNNSFQPDMIIDNNQHHLIDETYSHMYKNNKYYNNNVYSNKSTHCDERLPIYNPQVSKVVYAPNTNIQSSIPYPNPSAQHFPYDSTVYQNMNSHLSPNYGYNNVNKIINPNYIPSSDMYSLNSAKISSNHQSNHKIRSPSTNYYDTISNEKFNFIDLEEQINSSKIMKSRDAYYKNKYQQLKSRNESSMNSIDEQLKNQNLRDFLSSWNEGEDEENVKNYSMEQNNKSSSTTTTHIEINNSTNTIGAIGTTTTHSKYDKRNCDDGKSTPRIHVGITVGNSNNINNLPDIIIDIEKPKLHSTDDPNSSNISNKSEKLYVLESIDVPVSDLNKYKHLSVVNKLPENIIHIARTGGDGEFGENIEASLKFIEEIENNCEKYYKNDFELNIESHDKMIESKIDCDGRKLVDDMPENLAPFYEDYNYEYDVKKFLNESLDLIEAEMKVENNLIPKDEFKCEKIEENVCTVEDTRSDIVEEKYVEDIKIENYKKRKQITTSKKSTKRHKIEQKVILNTDFTVRSLQSICVDYLNSKTFRLYFKLKFLTNPIKPIKSLREICEEKLKDYKISIIFPEPLTLRETCENFIINHKDHFIIHEATDDIFQFPTLKELCESVLETNFYIDVSQYTDDSSENNYDINELNINNCYLSVDDEMETVSSPYDENDRIIFSCDDINEIIIDDPKSITRTIYNKLCVKYSKQKNCQNNIFKKIIKKYVYYIKRCKLDRKNTKNKFIKKKNHVKKVFQINCDTKPKLDTTLSIDLNTSSYDIEKNNIKEIITINDVSKINLKNESHIIAKDVIDLNKNNNDDSKIQINQIKKPHKKRKLNFDEMLLNIDKYYSKNYSANTNVNSSDNNFSKNDSNNNNYKTKSSSNINKMVRNMNCNANASGRKVTRLVIPQSKILNLDELKTVKENNIRLPYVKLERNIYIDKLARKFF